MPIRSITPTRIGASPRTPLRADVLPPEGAETVETVAPASAANDTAGAEAAGAAMGRGRAAMASLRGSCSSIAVRVAAAYSTAPIIRPGQFVDMFA